MSSAAAGPLEPPKAAFMVIGNEILSGSVTDINTPWLAKLLFRYAFSLFACCAPNATVYWTYPTHPSALFSFTRIVLVRKHCDCLSDCTCRWLAMASKSFCWAVEGWTWCEWSTYRTRLMTSRALCCGCGTPWAHQGSCSLVEASDPRMMMSPMKPSLRHSVRARTLHGCIRVMIGALVQVSHSALITPDNHGLKRW